MTALSAGVIGLGVGEQHIHGYACPPKCAVVALCDISPAKLSSAATHLTDVTRTGDWRRLVEDQRIDIISIASFDDDHFEQTNVALTAGKHVFVEKPLCRTSEQLRSLKLSVWQARRHLTSNLVLREAPLYVWLRQAIQDGEFGEVYAFDGDYLYGRLNKITDGWRKNQTQYSVMQGGGIHLVDLMLWCTEQRPTRVTSVGNGVCTRDSDFEPNDFASATFQFDTGMVARITANFGCVHRHQHAMRVFGTKATFIYDDQGARIMRSRDPKRPAERIPLSALPSSKHVLIPSLLDAVLTGADPRQRAQLEFDTMSVCLAADRSMQAGQALEIDYV